MNRLRTFSAAQAVFLTLLPAFALAQASPQFKHLDQVAPEAITRSMALGRTDPDQPVHLAISLPYADPGGMQMYVDSVSDPANVNYRRFLTPQEVGARFGLSQSAVLSVANYLQGQGFKIDLIAKNRLGILAEGTVGQAESAFRTQIEDFHAFNPDEPGNQDFFSFTDTLQVPAAIRPFVATISGLESYTKPEFRALTPTQARTLYDLAPMYNAGKQGQGRTVGISNWDGYRLTNVPLYYSQYSLPTPPGGVGSNITVITISGGAGSGHPAGEGDLDIQMVLGMAPLCNLRIYDGGNSDLIGVLTSESSENLCDVITESYGWSLDSATAQSAHNQHLAMSAEGITYMCASGDSGTSLEPYSYPNYDPEVLMVGGTIATVDSNGNRSSEVGWSGSGGGWSTNTASFNTLPSYEHGTGVPTNINYRLLPDVSLHAAASTGAYYFYLNGSLTNAYIGTSFACPVFAGSLAVAEQQIISQGGLPADGSGHQRFGRIQDLFYSQNGRSDVWYDITSGTNGNLPNGQTSSATTAWDFVTGWGAIDFNAFVATQVSSTSSPPAPTNLVATGGNGTVGLTWNTSSGATSYNVKRSTTSGGPYSTIASPTTNSYTDNSVTNGLTYYYVVSAVNTYGESADSGQASATPNVPAPAAPTNLAATSGNAQVGLTWTGSSGATSYNVKRSTSNGGPYSTIGSTGSASFTDYSVTNGVTYYYVVSAVNSGGESGNSNQVSATPNIAPPATPTGVTATPGPGSKQITVSWNAVSDPYSSVTYRVYSSGKSNRGFKLVATVSGTSYTQTFRKSHQTAYYYVVTVDAYGNTSGNSTVVQGTSL